MTQEEKNLLLKDLCGRLPYGVKLLYNSNSIANIKDRVEILRGITIGYTIWFETNYDHYEYESTSGSYEHFKPYLRPMSSMAEEEKKELERLIDEKLNKHIGQEDDEWTPWILYDTTGIKNYVGGERFYFDEMSFIYDWLNAHHFDYRGLIPKGLALEAPKEMYNN